MSLDFNVLWIDDRPNQVRNAKEHIALKLNRKGFVLNVDEIQTVSNVQKLSNKIKSNDYDLIVVDFKFDSSDLQGDDIIKAIRRSCFATDIVFYSSCSPSELRRHINVDGVYCASRNNIVDILDKVIYSTVKKALDLNQMRGIFLAMVADFDHVLDGILDKSYSLLGDESLKEKIKEDVIKIASNFHEEQLENINSLDKNSDFDKFINMLSSTPKHELMKRIFVEIDNENLDFPTFALDKYVSEIISPRNQLAHSMLKERKAGKYVLINKTKTFEYDHDRFVLLRTKLLEYKESFEKLERILDEIWNMSEGSG